MLSNSTNSALIDTNDEGLRKYVHSQSKVFAIFTSADCPICDALEPSFAHLVGGELSSGIQLVRLNSDENPVAKRLMAERVAPFLVSYNLGRMIECGTCETESEMLAQLKRLRALA